MKRLAVLPVILLLLAGVPVLAEDYSEKGNAFMEDFIKAINTGNYSLIVPYLGEQLKVELGEGAFNQLREFIVENYGRLLSFEFLNEMQSGDMVKLEYDVRAEKGSFPVALTFKNGELIGIGLGVRAKPNPLGMVAMILGVIVAIGAFYPLRKPAVPDLVLGAGIALGLSVIVPFYGIVSLPLFSSSLWRALFTGIATAFTVEAVKFYFSRTRDGFSLGLGLGLGQYVLLAIGTFVATNFILQLPVSFTGPTYWAFLVALAFTSFHALSGGSYSQRRDFKLIPLFATLEAISLALEGTNTAVALALVLIGIALGLKLGGIIDGVTGRKAH